MIEKNKKLFQEQIDSPRKVNIPSWNKIKRDIDPETGLEIDPAVGEVILKDELDKIIPNKNYDLIEENGKVKVIILGEEQIAFFEDTDTLQPIMDINGVEGTPIKKPINL